MYVLSCERVLPETGKLLPAPRTFFEITVKNEKIPNKVIFPQL